MGAVKDLTVGPYEVNHDPEAMIEFGVEGPEGTVALCTTDADAQLICDALNLYHKVHTILDFRVISGG